MDLTVPAAMAVIGFVFTVAAALLLLSWVQRRELAPLALWGLAFAAGAIGVLLAAGRGHISEVWSIGVANLLIAACYGALWSGGRLLDGRRASIPIALLGVAVWLVAFLIPGFFGDRTARAMLLVAVNVSYTVATAVGLWRARGDRLPSRWPAIALLLLHAVALPSRLPVLSDYLGLPHWDASLIIFVTFESMLLAMAGAYLFGGLVREQVAKGFQRAAMSDPLTGVANRRAFLQTGARLISRAAVDKRHVSLLLFDIDHFKSINDRYGHAAGDEVLTVFCQVAQAQLRPRDLFARIGGEEFACLLIDVDAAAAVRIAERVLFKFEGWIHSDNGRTFGVTASAGVAHARPGAPSDLSALMVDADRALYRAKNGGRNRIEEETRMAAGSAG